MLVLPRDLQEIESMMGILQMVVVRVGLFYISAIGGMTEPLHPSQAFHHLQRDSQGLVTGLRRWQAPYVGLMQINAYWHRQRVEQIDALLKPTTNLDDERPLRQGAVQ
ncbi:MAG: hypothetical protein COA42_17855 [Alteromonadaceae bacterium]|nr:MAG: hypothetical protein COA42_17855 [Alteromonadaceae bacterium]